MDNQKCLETLIEGLKKQICTSLDITRELQQDEEVIKVHESCVDNSEPFVYEVERL